jgi:putative oxidoreductase
MSSGTIGTETQSSHPALSCTDRIAASWQDFLLLVARVLIGWIFIDNAWAKLKDVPAFVKTMPRRDLPEVLGYIAPWVEIIGGILIVVGFATRYAAILMLLFMIVATFSSHRWWNYPEAQRGNQYAHFWKNITIIGGVVLLFVTAGGRWSLDAILRRR